MNVSIETIGGNCPVQADGTIAGKPFYFRARGERWSIGIGGDPIGDPEWFYGEPYGTEEYAASWMPVEEAEGFIHAAAARYLREQSRTGVGKPG
jgi:hypothetical protein